MEMESHESLLPERVQIARSYTTSAARQKRVALLVAGIGTLALVIAVIVTVSSHSKSAEGSGNQGGDTELHSSDTSRASAQTRHFRSAAVAPDAEDCASIGTKLLEEKGASAVDAAIATLLCNGLHNAHSTGIGGGHFMLIYDKPKDGTKKELFALDAREVAPLAADKYMFVNSTFSPADGPGSIAVPGEIAGMWAAWKRFGRVPWKELLQPAIHMARFGMKVGKSLARAISSQEKKIRQDDTLSEIFIKPEGSLAEEGDTIYRKKLAVTLETIATEGGDTFYTGSLAKLIAKDLKDIGSIITKEDLEVYKPTWRTPISMRLRVRNRNLTLHTFPPPGGGLVVAFILNILQGYNFTSESLKTIKDRVHTYHSIIEAFKFAFAKRTLVGDPAFVEGVDKLVKNLTSEVYGDHVRSQISDYSTHNISYYHPSFAATTDSGTSHTSIIAPDGSAVAVTGTVNTQFGSEKAGSRTGIIFNNEMDDFSQPDKLDAWGLPPSPINFIEPGKKPTSSMCPTIVTEQQGTDDPVAKGSDSGVKVVIGASGGTKIITGVAYALIHHLFLGYGIEDAIHLPRFHHQLVPQEVAPETDFPQDILAGLKLLGHKVADPSSSHSVVQAVTKSCDQCVTAVCDTRKDGVPDGF